MSERPAPAPVEPIVIRDLHRGIAVNPEREDLFRDQFLGYLDRLGIRRARIGPDRLRSIVKAIFEAIVNVYDHASRGPARLSATTPERLSSFLSVEPIDGGILVIVQDNGVGIPSRQAQDVGIYRRAFADEAEAFREALRPRGSAKLVAQDCRVRGTPGYGYTYIAVELGRAGCLAYLRSGHVMATLGPDGEFDVSNHRQTRMLGTRLSIAVPFQDPNPGAIP